MRVLMAEDERVPAVIPRSWATVRVRLTAFYGGLFVLATTGLLLVVNLFLQHSLDNNVAEVVSAQRVVPGGPPQFPEGPPMRVMIPPGGQQAGIARPMATIPDVAKVRDGTALGTSRYIRKAVLQTQWTMTFILVAAVAVITAVAGWWLAGRMLRPLHRITATARRLSLSTLDERISLTGPNDELKELADTFDAMLERLERAVDSQRRFVANASHELRTPLAIQRAAIEIGLEDPSPDEVAQMRAELLAANLRTERLIDGLLVLAQGERGLDAREPVDLEEIAAEAVQQHARGGIAVHTDLARATVAGDPVLLARLAGNLVQNAVHYNHPGGDVNVTVTADGVLQVSNTGPLIPEDRIQELFEPFRRLHATRTASADGGAGLGLSIVAAIARAHDAQLTARPNPGGGLTVSVTFHALARIGDARILGSLSVGHDGIR